MLTVEYCRVRQQRLLQHMEKERLDLVVLANPKTIYYFSGVLTDSMLPQTFALNSSGKSLLITNQDPKQSAADRVNLYTGYSIDRPFNRTSMFLESVLLVREILVAGSVGIETDFVPAVISEICGQKKVNITPAIDHMRRIKDPDEIDSIRDTIRLTEAGYAAVRGRLEPGMAEFEVYAMFHEALVRHAQTSVDLRGDFACGTRAIRGGGPPTARKLQPGDLYILDIFPFYHGYHCDLARTFAVGRPSAMQQEAWEVVSKAHDLAAKLIRPGVKGRDVYHQIRAHLESFTACAGSFWHHLGHGFGMNGWEFPWLTPGSDHVVQEGEVLAVEPGVYGECLNGGIRLEHNYLVGKDGITALDQFPLDL
ncbi:MAG TPA: Xaa-Pro peptidase family protein [Bryobacterales bacterium]|nr:Xaa-Pro peptidase family protein [Bryobacterales bacterium]